MANTSAVQYANIGKNTAEIDTKDWICIYPAYIDADRTLAQGRRIGKHLSTKNPDAMAIFFVCGVKLQLQAVLEKKAYSRSWWDIVGPGIGRVKVRLKDDKGEYSFVDKSNPIGVDKFTSRKQLLLKVAEILNDPSTQIPPNYRPVALKEEQMAFEAAEEEERKAAKAVGGSSNKKKKKGKKKRR